ncbi:glutaredoxin [Pleomassaria siparia CBS 279.74]|uniref:Glutaredoxin n=1 Tax=Pleomassaria siparia CBS 279.74 TaxID=1314801 RepID=A0A6G1KKD4_9PLEO|nr:glutaredoxin [Pleomassaria siparia CBS 279.74]
MRNPTIASFRRSLYRSAGRAQLSFTNQLPSRTLLSTASLFQISSVPRTPLSQSNCLQTLQHQGLHPPTATISFLRSLFTRASPTNMSATKTKVQSIIDENAVAVFSKSYCPYCNAAKQLLSDSGAKFYAIELDQVDDGSAIQSTLADITGQRTVPNIFIGQQHIGGNSDLQAKKGTLKNLLKEAGAV